MVEDHSFVGMLNQITKTEGIKRLAAITVMRSTFFSNENLHQNLVFDTNLLKVLVALILANTGDQIDRHVAINSYWILSHIANSNDIDVLRAIFADELNLIIRLNADLLSDDFELIEMILWFIANVVTPDEVLLKLIICNTDVVKVLEKLTYMLANGKVKLSDNFMSTVGFASLNISAGAEQPTLLLTVD